MIDPTASLNVNSGATTPTIIYDGGPRTIQRASAGAALNNSGFTLAAGVAGLKTKVVAVTGFCYVFTAAGLASLRGGTPTDFFLGYVAALGASFSYSGEGLVIYETTAAANLTGFFTGNAQVAFSVLYYQAP